MVTQNASVLTPVFENKVVSSGSQDRLADSDRPLQTKLLLLVALVSFQLHRLPVLLFSCSLSSLDLQSAVSLDSPPESWIDRELVQVQLHNCSEQSRVAEWERASTAQFAQYRFHCCVRSKKKTTLTLRVLSVISVSTCRPSLIFLDSQEGELNCKNEVYLQEEEVDQHQVFGKSFSENQLVN